MNSMVSRDTDDLPQILHDVKNPLAAALGYLEWAELQDLTVLESARQAIAYAIDVANSALRPKDAGADVPLELLGRVHQLRQMFLLRCQQRQATIDIGRWQESTARDWPLDPRQFDRLIYNLLDNALEAMGDSGGSIMIEWLRTPRFRHLTVKDTGLGLPGEGSRYAGRRSSKGEGHGLGNQIVTRIAQELGGTIVVGRVVPHGTKVTVRWPVLN